MPVDSDALEKLAARVGEFYITDKAMKKAQDRITALLASHQVEDAAAKSYLAAARSYFSGFETEAREHLRSVDKRLEQINQVHFNLSAERSVAVRRIEATRGVLSDIDSLGAGTPLSGTPLK